MIAVSLPPSLAFALVTENITRGYRSPGDLSPRIYEFRSETKRRARSIFFSRAPVIFRCVCSAQTFSYGEFR